MKEYIVNLCSFVVQAESEEEAQLKANKQLESRQVKPVIESVFEG